MSAKNILFDQECRDAIRRGVVKLSHAVKVTLGPRGRNVAIQKSFGSPTVTKDGVTVAKEIELEDRTENIGAQMVKQVASKTSEVAGDGTTTATVLAEAIFCEGLKNVVAGAAPLGLKHGLDQAVQAVVAGLRKMSVKIKDRKEIEQVAAIAANNDHEIGKMIADAMDKVGKDGVVTVEEGKSLATTVEWVEGMQLDKGYLSAHFVTDAASMQCVLDQPYILIREKKITSIKDLLPLLEKITKVRGSLLVMAEDVEGEALATLVVNRLRGVLSCCAIKAPGFGDRRKAMLEDIAVLTGGKALFEDIGMDLAKLELSDLGRVKRVVVDKDTTTLVEGAGSTKEIQGRIGQIKNEIENTTSEYDREKLQERLAKLSGGVAQVNVGAATEVEMKEKKARVEDALHATRAAIEEGILPGGGVPLARMQKTLSALSLSEEERVGAEVLGRALPLPLMQIAENAGFDGHVVLDRVLKSKEKEFGFNAQTCEFENLIDAGVIDPTKVVRVALQNAASVASLLLTTEALVSELSEEKEEAGLGARSPMGGDF